MNRLKQVLSLGLCLTLALSCLAGCGGEETADAGDSGVITVANSPDEVAAADTSKGTLSAATDFTFDFETLEYSFAGVENAEFYYIRVFPVEDGVESKSASFQSEKIDATGENTYSGVIEGQTLLAGDYVAHVVASAAGYASSDAQASGVSTRLASAEVSAQWNTGSEENPAVTADVSITAGDDIVQTFTVTITNEAGEEVYRDDSAKAGAYSLTAADLGAEILTVEDVYNVTVTVNPVSGYIAPDEGTTVQITEPMMGPGGPG